MGLGAIETAIDSQYGWGWTLCYPVLLLKKGYLEPDAQDPMSRWVWTVSKDETPQPLWSSCASAQSNVPFRRNDVKSRVKMQVFFSYC